ncbi:T9SS type A sorting domain-containing protein [Lentimicrobium sp. S6]|uniref:T9SS type A sorting domain-containing protein n=1 Tax=Lentimicrobium sp. S6 TaxID=2735872 RepID=UPI0015518F4D|nr:T9SS type A sorting domain-containing protein [Lentimicrobium sp. S6]NPD45721.1 T9SS type A sorting domain-containing protein [Lentimicrobium sp. S6]
MKHLLISLLFFFNISLFSQNFSFEFQNEFNIDARDYPISSTQENYFVAFSVVDINDNFRTNTHLITCDIDGQIEEVMIYESPNEIISLSCDQILHLPNGEKLLSGIYAENSSPPYHPYIMNITEDGQVNWAKKINSGTVSSVKIELLSDDSILVLLRSSGVSNHYIICKMDLQGNFSNINELGSFQYVPKKISSYDGYFELLFVDGNLMSIDNDLSNINWQRKYYNEIGKEYSRAENGDYIFVSAQVSFPGYMTVYRTDADGNTIWAQYIEAWHGQEQNQISIFDIVDFHFIEEDLNGNIIISANSEGGLFGSLQMVLDADGNYISNYKINTYKNKMRLIDKQNYLVGGFQNTSSYNSSNFVFEKRGLATSYPCDSIYNYSIASGEDMNMTPDEIDLTPFEEFTVEDIDVVMSSGNFEQNEYCDMLLQLDRNPSIQSQVELYPNPSNDRVSILSEKEISNIKIYNALGFLIEETEYSFIDLNDYPRGIYLIQIELDSNQKVIKKMVKN